MRLGVVAIGMCLAMQAAGAAPVVLRARELPPIAELPDVPDFVGAGWMAFAQLAAGNAPGHELEVAALARARALAGSGDDVAVAESTLQLRVANAGTLALEHTGLLAAEMRRESAISLVHRFELGARPLLAAPPLFVNASFARENLRLHFEGINIGERTGWDIMAFGLGWTWVQQVGAAHQVGLSLDLPLLRHVRFHDDVDTVFDFLRIGADGLKGELGVAVIDVTLAGVRELHVLPGVRLDLEGGAGGPGRIEETVDSGGQTVSHTVIQTPDTIPRTMRWLGRAALHAQAGPVTLELEAARRMYPTFRPDLALDDRLTATVTARTPRVTAALSGFAARTELWATDGSHQRVPTGGGSAALGIALGRREHLGLSVEAARSFYAGEGSPVAFGVRGFGTLTIELARSRPKSQPVP